MSRFARVVVPGCPHHVTHRGNLKAAIFFTDHDRNLYLRVLADQCRGHEVAVLAWCLMPNHVHLIVRPERHDSLSKAIGRTEVEYARWIHTAHRQVGHLWQDRYFSCPLEGSHLRDAMRYVELNPVRAALVANAWDWPWSSARAHLASEDRRGLLDLASWPDSGDPGWWKDVLCSGYTYADAEAHLREATRSGRPFGSEHFTGEVERQLGRAVRRQKRGPKAKAAVGEQMSFGIS
jgi:putative transposase